MMIDGKIIATTIFLICTLVIGMVLSKPYNIGAFTLHKLLALGFVVLTGVVIKNFLNSTTTDFEIVIFTILIIAIIALVITGAMMSFEGFNHILLKKIHFLSMTCLMFDFVAIVVQISRKV